MGKKSGPQKDEIERSSQMSRGMEVGGKKAEKKGGRKRHIAS